MHPLASPGGSCLRSFAPQTDEGRGALTFWNNCKAIQKCSPTLIRLASLAPFPEGKVWGACVSPLRRGFGSSHFFLFYDYFLFNNVSLAKWPVL